MSCRQPFQQNYPHPPLQEACKTTRIRRHRRPDEEDRVPGGHGHSTFHHSKPQENAVPDGDVAFTTTTSNRLGHNTTTPDPRHYRASYVIS